MRKTVKYKKPEGRVLINAELHSLLFFKSSSPESVIHDKYSMKIRTRYYLSVKAHKERKKIASSTSENILLRVNIFV